MKSSQHQESADLLPKKELGGSDPEKHDTTRILPPISEIIAEGSSLFNLAFPTVLVYLILYSRSMVAMLFLGHIGELELAGGSLAIAFANITGYSVLSGLALGMEPLCSQAFGARKSKLLSLTLQRTVLFLLAFSIPISVLWLNLGKVMLFLHQDPSITAFAQTYIIYSLPDLLSNSFVNPIRIYLRTQGITRPLTIATLAGTVMHLPISFFLVSYLRLGLAGVSIASASSNLSVSVFLLCYMRIEHKETWTNPLTNRECFKDWGPLMKLAAPSCVSVCLEWWWYEIMTVLCGLLPNPKAPVAAMGILIQTTSLQYIFPSSLGSAVSTRVGNELGANRPKAARLAATVAVIFAGGLGLTFSAFAWGMRDVWGRMFTMDSEILQLTAIALPILGLCELGNCPQTVGCGVVRGSARPSVAANINLGAFYLVGTPVAVGLTFFIGLGFSGLWWGLFAAQICCATMMLYVVASTDWEFEAKKAKVLTSTGTLDVLINGEDKDDTTEAVIRVTVVS